MQGVQPDPSVFVVILNWNGKSCLNDTLRSVFKLRYGNFQVVVVDNDSRDGSFEEARKSFGRAHFIRNESNVGFARGMNVGIRYALGSGAKYVWILNNDAQPEEGSLRELVIEADNRPGTILSPLILTPSGSVWYAGGLIRWWRMRVKHETTPISGTDSYPTGFITGCAMFLPVETIRKIGIFDEKFFLYYEDADLSSRAIRSGVELAVVPRAIVMHREQSEENPEKVYYLVLSGLQFFLSSTPWPLRLFTFCLTMARRVKNGVDVIRRKPGSIKVRRAYQDYASQKASL